MRADDAVRLFGKKRAQFERALRNLQLRHEIDETVDFLQLSDKFTEATLYLSHRAVISLGYSLNFGRASTFRIWSFAQLQFDRHARDVQGDHAAFNERPLSFVGTPEQSALA